MDHQWWSLIPGFLSVAVAAWVPVWTNRLAKTLAKERDLAAFRADVDTRLDHQGQRLQRLETLAHPTPSHPVDTTFDDHAERLARMEQDLRHAPSQEDLKRLHARLDNVSEELREIKGEFHGARRTLDLIHQHLLNGGDRL